MVNKQLDVPQIEALVAQIMKIVGDIGEQAAGFDPAKLPKDIEDIGILAKQIYDIVTDPVVESVWDRVKKWFS